MQLQLVSTGRSQMKALSLSVVFAICYLLNVKRSPSIALITCGTRLSSLQKCPEAGERTFVVLVHRCPPRHRNPSTQTRSVQAGWWPSLAARAGGVGGPVFSANAVSLGVWLTLQQAWPAGPLRLTTGHVPSAGPADQRHARGCFL